MNRHAAVGFGEVQRALALFAQGVAGRSVQLQPLPVVGAAGHMPSITTDAVVIRLPAQIDRFAQREHNRGAYRMAVLHQIGYLECGSLDFTPVLQRCVAAARRPALLRRVFVALEDLRVDAALLRCYPGAREDMQRVFADALARRPPRSALLPAAAMVEALVQFSLGAPRAALLQEGDRRSLCQALDLAASLEMPSATVRDSARAALRICVGLESSARPLRRREAGTSVDAAAEPPAIDAAPNTDVEAQDDGETAAIDLRSVLLPDPALRQLAGARGGRTACDAPLRKAIAADGAAPATPAACTPFGAQAASARAARGDEPHIYYVDEWDCHQRRYLKTWCRVVEQRLRGDDHAFIHEVRRRHAELAGQVKRRFGLIRPESLQRVHRTDDGDELDLDAVVQARVERRAGQVGDERAYVRRDRARRDVAAALLLDMSASTDHPVRDDAPPSPPSVPSAGVVDHDVMDCLYGRHDPGDVPPPSPPQRRVIDVAKEALALMCDALHRLGDSHAVYGFSGAGRDHVEFHVAKDFDEKLTTHTWAALAAMQPRGSTRTGAAIRHATGKLARRTARVRVLIVVSDGYPQDQDYGPDPKDEEYGLQDSARALQEAERGGVAAFCLTIDPAGRDYMRRMCAAHRYQVIDDVRQLPRALSQVYRALTGEPRRPVGRIQLRHASAW